MTAHRSNDSARPLVVTAELASPLAGDAPQLDSVLESAMVLHMIGAGVVPRTRVDRGSSLSNYGRIPIPLEKRLADGYEIACCSSPILDAVDCETVTHFHKKFDTNATDILAPDALGVIASGGGEFKSYRLPLRIRVVSRVRWLCVGSPRAMRRELRRIHAIGKKPAFGYGRVAAWTVEERDGDHSWFSPLDDGRRVLMRPLPIAAVEGDALIVGWRPYYGAVQPPYWHPERFMEVAVPC